MALIDLSGLYAILGGRLPGSFSGALVLKSVDQSTVDDTPTTLIWQTEDYDFGGWFDSSGDDFFTVPSGVHRVKLHAGVLFEASALLLRLVWMTKNSAAFNGAPSHSADPTNSSFQDSISLASPTIEVVPGDTFELNIHAESTTPPLDVLADESTYFAIEAV